VGYGSPFALSVAFKRAFGRSPRQHRRGAAANAVAVIDGLGDADADAVADADAAAQL
jgi:Bacterial regulatory helix-turn-helix proteins, AraC family